MLFSPLITYIIHIYHMHLPFVVVFKVLLHDICSLSFIYCIVHFSLQLYVHLMNCILFFADIINNIQLCLSLISNIAHEQHFLEMSVP